MPCEWATERGDPHRVGRAAAALAVVGRIGPELERDREDVGPSLALPQGRDGAVDATAHGNQHPLAAVGGRRQDRLRRGRDGDPERPVGRLGGEIGGMCADRAEAAELGGHGGGVEEARLVQRGPVEELGGGGPGGAGRSAAARLHPDVGDATAGEPQRDRDQVAAGGTAGRPASRIRARARRRRESSSR